jgi:hypothetical protein
VIQLLTAWRGLEALLRGVPAIGQASAGGSRSDVGESRVARHPIPRGRTLEQDVSTECPRDRTFANATARTVNG